MNIVDKKKTVLVEIDWICKSGTEPCRDRVEQINELFHSNYNVVYWSPLENWVSGSIIKSGAQYYMHTQDILMDWGCRYSSIVLGKEKSRLSFDIFIGV